MKKVWKWIKSLFSNKNLGHRLYGDFEWPENSMLSLVKGIDKQRNKNFKYWEFDVIESADALGGSASQLFVFHDATKRKTVGSRLCPNAPRDSKNKSIYELTPSEIVCLTLFNTKEKIPMVYWVIDSLINNAIKPVNVEIKKLRTKKMQKHLIEMVEWGNRDGKVEFYFSMFKNKFGNMPNNGWFLNECKKKNIRFEFMGV